MKRLSLVILAISVVSAQAAPLDITGAWFRSLPGKLPAGGYFTAQNNSRRDVAITGAMSEACGMLMIHQSSNKGGMSSMEMMEQVKVPARAQVTFAPGGTHLMCEGAKMKIGTRVPVLLKLSDGTAVAVAFEVKGATGK
ncbi:MAG: copper chaperone PCu(A)C [Alphaproteobacteria bacterium]|nr:copper chaperone PCu(A)C [Alphaproteobacteria bacterium]